MGVREWRPIGESMALLTIFTRHITIQYTPFVTYEHACRNYAKHSRYWGAIFRSPLTMIGLIHHGPSDTDGVAPSVSPALYSVGGTPAVTRAMNELTSVVDEMLLLTDDADVRSAAARADDSVAVVPDLDAVRDRFADAHDRLIVASASTHVGRSDLRSLTACTDAVLRSAAIPNGHPPHEMYSIDFPLGDAQPIDGDIDSIRDLVDALSARTHESELTADRLYDVARPWDLLAATEHVLDGSIAPSREPSIRRRTAPVPSSSNQAHASARAWSSRDRRSSPATPRSGRTRTFAARRIWGKLPRRSRRRGEKQRPVLRRPGSASLVRW